MAEVYRQIIEKVKPELAKVMSFLEKELAKLRTGRASTSLVEDIMVPCFGQNLPLKQLGAISISEPRQIVIQPWDKSYIEPIIGAFSKQNMGLSPVVDKDVIRINLPLVDEEYRKNIVKIVSEIEEEAKKTIRKWRDEAWDEIQEKFKEGIVREDDKFRGKDELQKLIDDHNKKVEEAGERKKKEIMF